MFFTAVLLNLFLLLNLTTSSPLYNKTSPAFGLLAIRSGSPLQYQSVVISSGGLYLSGGASDPYYFKGVIFPSGGLKVVTDETRFESDSYIPSWLTVDGKGQYVLSTNMDNSFSIKDGHLLYQGKDGASAVATTHEDYSYAVYQSGPANATGIALRTVGKGGEAIGNYP